MTSKIVDQIEVTENGCVQVRLTSKNTNGEQSFHRFVVTPGDDYSGVDERVQSICASTHTLEVIEAYKAAVAAQGV